MQKEHNQSAMNTDVQSEKAHDEFEPKDEFKKERVNFKTLNIKKILKFIFLGILLLALVFYVGYWKLKRNKENRISEGVETSVAKPVEQNDANATGVDHFGFNRSAIVTNDTNSTNANEKSAEQLEYERKLAEQEQILALQQAQLKEEERLREQALLVARQKSNILVSGGNLGSGTNSVNTSNEDVLGGIPPELQPLFAGMQIQGGDSQQSNNNPRIANTTASSLGGRFDSSSSNDIAPISHASYKPDRRLLIQQGKIVDAVLETSVKSDLPSNIIARITDDIYSEQGRNILLPKGTRLFGQYSSLINDGQTEIGAIWNRAITPNGIEIMLDSPSTNGLGIAGLGGRVNNHYGRIFGTATLLSLIGAGVSNVGVNSNDQNNASQTYRTNVANSFGNQSNSILNRNLSIPPTITVEHGSRIKVLVAKDLDFSTIFNQ